MDVSKLLDWSALLTECFGWHDFVSEEIQHWKSHSVEPGCHVFILPIQHLEGQGILISEGVTREFDIRISIDQKFWAIGMWIVQVIWSLTLLVSLRNLSWKFAANPRVSLPTSSFKPYQIQGFAGERRSLNLLFQSSPQSFQKDWIIHALHLHARTFSWE